VQIVVGEGVAVVPVGRVEHADRIVLDKDGDRDERGGGVAFGVRGEGGIGADILDQ